MRIVQLCLFLITLILHLIFCNKALKHILSPFGVYGIFWWGLLSTTQMRIINYPAFSYTTLICFYLAYISMGAGVLLMLKKRRNVSVPLYNSADCCSINHKMLNFISKSNGCFILCSFLSVMFMWGLTIKYWGSLHYIFKNAYLVRMTSIGIDGVQIVPVLLNYISSIFKYSSLFTGSYLLFFKKSRWSKKLFYIFPLFLAFIDDLRTFSRMGIIFALLIYGGALLIAISSKCIRLRYGSVFKFVLLLSAVSLIILLPKIIRSNGFTVSELQQFTDIKIDNVILEAFFTLYSYATGAFAAFDSFIKSWNGTHTYGAMCFLPIENILSRLLTGESSGISLIYEFREIPFSTNIYTWLREIYTDFGFVGIVLFPFFIGIISQHCSNHKTGDKHVFVKYAILVYMYLLLIYSVIYFPFSQGGPVIGFAACIVYAILLDSKRNQSTFIEKRKARIEAR